MLQPISDVNLELETGWGTHIPSDGSQIGGNDPLQYTLIPSVPGQSGGVMALSVRGGAYSTFESYLTRNSFADVGLPYCTLGYAILLDANVPVTDQIIETDMIVIGGDAYKYNLSHQININEGWMLQGVNAAGSWVDSGNKIPAMASNTPYTVAIKGFVDLPNKQFSLISTTVNQTVYNFPASIQKVAATASTWPTRKITPQFQKTLNANGGVSMTTFSKISLVWTAS